MCSVLCYICVVNIYYRLVWYIEWMCIVSYIYMLCLCMLCECYVGVVSVGRVEWVAYIIYIIYIYFIIYWIYENIYYIYWRYDIFWIISKLNYIYLDNIIKIRSLWRTIRYLMNDYESSIELNFESFERSPKYVSHLVESPRIRI